MNSLNKTQLADKIVEKLKKGQIKMRPRAHFVLKTILAGLAAIITGLFVLFLISFIVFILRANGVLVLPRFGLRGIMPFLASLPWLLIILTLLLIVVLELLVKYFSFSYRRPVLYSVLVIILIVLLGGLVIGKTSLHKGMLDFARQGRLPAVGGFYQNFGEIKLSNARRAVILEKIESGFRAEAQNGEALEIIIGPQTRLPSGIELEPGDTIIILGKNNNGVVRAVGIRPIKNLIDFEPLPMPLLPGYIRGWRR